MIYFTYCFSSSGRVKVKKRSPFGVLLSLFNDDTGVPILRVAGWGGIAGKRR
ncbi:MAG: hypothetical protein F6K09_27245 [Merismopedia sp. SIO2A8]|nr:hypothetical protein [Merismopedia sp. SIO2A8]